MGVFLHASYPPKLEDYQEGVALHLMNMTSFNKDLKLSCWYVERAEATDQFCCGNPKEIEKTVDSIKLETAEVKNGLAVSFEDISHNNAAASKSSKLPKPVMVSGSFACD